MNDFKMEIPCSRGAECPAAIRRSFMWCSVCGGKGTLLTPFGKAVLELVKDHLEVRVLGQEHNLEDK